MEAFIRLTFVKPGSVSEYDVHGCDLRRVFGTAHVERLPLPIARGALPVRLHRTERPRPARSDRPGHTGLGFWTAVHLAKAGARVLIG